MEKDEIIVPFLNGEMIVNLEEYQRKVMNHEIKEKMVFQG